MIPLTLTSKLDEFENYSELTKMRSLLELATVFRDRQHEVYSELIPSSEYLDVMLDRLERNGMIFYVSEFSEWTGNPGCYYWKTTYRAMEALGLVMKIGGSNYYRDDSVSFGRRSMVVN